jgi:23S rRNA (adenine2503-C2)-methyltransferase
MSLPVPDLAPAVHPLERLPEEWAEVLAGWGEPRYRGLQVFQWIHQRGVFDPDAMTNLPKTLRARLHEEGLALPLSVAHLHPSLDGTRKLLVRMVDGSEVETVLIPQLEKTDPDADADECDDPNAGPTWVPGTVVTQCISSQVGCAMGCVFCASGVMGLKRHMTAAEIVSQVLLGRSLTTEREHLRNIVLMGMGEPLHNYDNVARALVLLTHPDGLALGKRRVTLSTSGLVPQIDRLARDFEGQVQLAISLHAVTDERRSSIMPINRKHSLEDLIACLKRYPLPKRRRITIEYTLIRGVNDDLRDADALVKLLRGVPAKVNLIPMNPISESTLAAPKEGGVTAFRERLFERGLSAFVRKTRGDDIAAACGQLAYHGDDGRRRRLPVA